MKLIILFFSLFYIVFNINADASSFCVDRSLVKDQYKFYSYTFNNLKCDDFSDCWIQFKSPEDSLKIQFNESSLIDMSKNNNYFSNEFLVFPAYGIQPFNKLVISAADINQDERFPKKLCINIGKHSEVRWRNAIDWFLLTGVNLFSVYFLVVMSFFILFSLIFKRSKQGFALAIYLFVSSIYLINFSEYPRAFFDPVLATGGYHFPLRLLQDLSLIFVFYNFFQYYDSYNFIKKISYLYGTVISVYILLLLIGIREYVYYSRIIIMLAPLVAMPMAIGTWFAFKVKNLTERKILIPIFILLFLFQLNDLFVFWRIWDGYFTVKFYIPFIVGTIVLLYIKRIHDDVLEISSTKEKQKIMKEFIHDVKSPIAVLRIFSKEQNISPERQTMIETAIDRIEGMMINLETPEYVENRKVEIISSINEIIEEKKVEFPDFRIVFNHSPSQVFSFLSKIQFQRILSNVINNSFESYANQKDKEVSITLFVGSDVVKIIISDKGQGIPKQILEKLFKVSVTSKKKGSGVGLMSAYLYIKKIGGEMNVISKEGVGTSIEIELNTVLGDVQTILDHEKNLKNDLDYIDYVLIDDDKYIRMSWEYFASNSMKKIRTFPNVESFLEVAEFINKDCVVYLDLNIGGEKSTKYVEVIHKRGFSKIILATGENIIPGSISNLVNSITGKLPPVH